MSHHLSDWQQQEQAQLRSIQSQIFWQGVWRARQHEQTNGLLRQNNRLLEQIRRNTLTPEQRAMEDAQRAHEAAQRAKAREEEYQQNIKLVCGISLVGIPLVLWCYVSPFFAISFVLGAAGVWRLIVQKNKQLGMGILSIAILAAFIGLAVAGPHFPDATLSPAGSAVPEPTATPEPTPVLTSQEIQAVVDARREQLPAATPESTASTAPRATLVRLHHHSRH